MERAERKIFRIKMPKLLPNGDFSVFNRFMSFGNTQSEAPQAPRQDFDDHYITPAQKHRRGR